MMWTPDFGEDEPPSIETAVYLAVGAASMCWENPAGAGVFNTDEARSVAEGLLAYIREASS